MCVRRGPAWAGGSDGVVNTEDNQANGNSEWMQAWHNWGYSGHQIHSKASVISDTGKLEFSLRMHWEERLCDPGPRIPSCVLRDSGFFWQAVGSPSPPFTREARLCTSFCYVYWDFESDFFLGKKNAWCLKKNRQLRSHRLNVKYMPWSFEEWAQ